MRFCLTCFLLVLCGCDEGSVPSVVFQHPNYEDDDAFFFDGTGHLHSQNFRVSGGLQAVRVRLYKIVDGETEKVGQTTFENYFYDKEPFFSGTLYLLSVRESFNHKSEIDGEDLEPGRVTIFGVSSRGVSLSNEEGKGSIPSGYDEQPFAFARLNEIPFGQETLLAQQHWIIPDPDASEPPIVFDSNGNIVSGIEELYWDIEKLESISKEKNRIIFYLTVEPGELKPDCPKPDCS